MRFAAVVAVVLISVSMALAQKAKDPVVHARPASRVSTHSTVVPPAVTNSSSAAELAKIEQQAAKSRLYQPVAHRPSGNTGGSAVATPALDLGKNKPIRVSRSPEPATPPR